MSSALPTTRTPIPVTISSDDDETALPSVPIHFRVISPEGDSHAKIKVASPDPKYTTIWDQWWRSTRWATQNKRIKIDWYCQRVTSNIWDTWSPVADIVTGKPWVLCTQCYSLMAHPSIKLAGTSGLKKHASSDTCKKNAKRLSKQPAKQQSYSQNDQSNCADIASLLSSQRIRQERQAVRDYTYAFESGDEEAFQRQLVLTMASLKLSFQSLAHPEFRKLVEMIHQFPSNQHLAPLSPAQVKAVLKNHAYEARREVLNQIVPGSRIAIALDCWTSPNNHAFIATTGHFIDRDWRSREVILGFDAISGKHRGSTLAGYIREALQTCDIPLTQVSAMTADNASNNGTLFSELNDALGILRNESRDTLFLRIPCLAHVIQLSSNIILGKVDEEQLAFENHSGPNYTVIKVHNFVKSIRNSSKRREDFHNCQGSSTKLNLVLNVKTRWNSTYNMLLRFQRLRSSVEEYIRTTDDDTDVESFRRREWRHIAYLIQLLAPFYGVTLLISRNQNGPSLHLVIRVFDHLIRHLTEYIDRLEMKRMAWKQNLRTALLSSRAKLRIYVEKMLDGGTDVYGQAMFLDPASKLAAFSNIGLDEISERTGVQYMDAITRKLTSHRESSSFSSESLSESRSTLSPTPSLPGLKKRKSNNFLYPEKRHRLQDPDSELDYYLHDIKNFGLDDDLDDHNAILTYWSRAQFRLPGLAHIAREILAIPASGVGVERLFSEARDIYTYRRHSLKPNTVKYLMILTSVGRLSRSYLQRQPEPSTEDADDYRKTPSEDSESEEDVENSDQALSDGEDNISDQEYDDSDTSEGEDFTLNRVRAKSTRRALRTRIQRRLRSTQEQTSTNNDDPLNNEDNYSYDSNNNNSNNNEKINNEKCYDISDDDEEKEDDDTILPLEGSQTTDLDPIAG